MTLDQMLAALPLPVRLGLERRYWEMVLEAAIADRSASAPRRETGVARKGESGGAGTAIAQGQIT